MKPVDNNNAFDSMRLETDFVIGLVRNALPTDELATFLSSPQQNNGGLNPDLVFFLDSFLTLYAMKGGYYRAVWDIEWYEKDKLGEFLLVCQTKFPNLYEAWRRSRFCIEG